MVGSLTVKEVKPSQDADALSIGAPLLPSISVIKKFGSATIGAPVAALNTSQRMVAENVEVLDLTTGLSPLVNKLTESPAPKLVTVARKLMGVPLTVPAEGQNWPPPAAVIVAVPGGLEIEINVCACTCIGQATKASKSRIFAGLAFTKPLNRNIK